MRYTFTIEIPEKEGPQENTHMDLLKAAARQFGETLDYASSIEGRRLMAKLKEKAGCDEQELIQECWEATDELLGENSCAVVGKALTGGLSAKPSSPFSNVTQKPVPTVEQEAGPEEVVKEEEEVEEEDAAEAADSVEEEAIPAPVAKAPAKTPRYPSNKKPPAPTTAVEASPAEKDPGKQPVLFPEENSAEETEAMKKDPEEQPVQTPGEEDVIPEENGEGTGPTAPPSPPPMTRSVKRPTKGMTGFAKKTSPYKKMPRFKKP